MPKITSKAALTRGTNYLFHLVDIQGVDIGIDHDNTQITSTTTDFTATTTTSGITKRPPVVGDRIKIANTANAVNEGVELEITSVAANAIGYTVVTGSPANEVAGSDINITAFKKTFEFVEASGLSFVDGVTAITWVSRVVDDWDADDLDIYDKMFTSIEPRAKSMACLNGWEPHNDVTLNALRDMALEIRDSATSAARRIYACARSDALHGQTDQFNYWPDSAAEMDPPIAAVTQGYINQLILIEDTDTGVDNKGLFTFRCLEPGKTHLQQKISLDYAEIYTVASNNDIDPKLADPGTGAQLVADATVVAAGSIYIPITLNVDGDESYDGDVNGTLFSFNGFADQADQTNDALHTKLHYSLRQPLNINNDAAGPQIRGDKAPPITTFSGDLMTLNDFYPLNFNSAQRNNLNAVDTSGITQSWPTIFTLSVTAEELAFGGTFSLIHENTYGASSPTYLEDENGVQQKDRPIAALTDIVVPYSTYDVDGHTPNTPIALRLVWDKPAAIEPDGAAFLMAAANQTRQIAAAADPSYQA